MKAIKILAASAIALALATSANAATTVRLTGATSYRANVHNAIINLMTAGGSYTYGYVGATNTKAAYAVYVGTINSNAVVIKTSWTGSEAGIQAVGARSNITFLADPDVNNQVDGKTLTSAGTASLTDPTANGATDGASEVADITLSDTAVSYSQFKSYSSLLKANSPAIVGICPFKWISSSTGKFSGITSQQIRTLYSNGSLSQAILTGSSADQGTFVFGLGRNPDSGSRLTAFGESGLGALKAVNQYQPLDSNGNVIKGTNLAAIATLQPWPSETINGITVDAFNSGYNSGGDLAAPMKQNAASFQVALSTGTTSYTNGVLVAYLAAGDADGAIGSGSYGAKELTFNGVKLGKPGVDFVGSDYNVAPNLVNGSYTFWSYERMYYRSNLTTSSVQKVTGDKIANQLATTDALVKPTSLQVKRDADGANVYENFH